MIDIERARAFVETYGTAIDRALLDAYTGQVKPIDVPSAFRSAQNDDGGFALDLQPDRPSSLVTTAQSLRWLHDLQLLKSSEAQKALHFMLDRQSVRGIWREHVELQVFNPPPWMNPDSPSADVYTTAICAGTLALVSGEDFRVDRAVTWLQTQQARDGLLMGFKAHSSWLAVPAFVQVFGQETRATRRLIAGLGEIVGAYWPGSMLAWMLQSLLDAGYTSQTLLVERAWDLLSNAQQPDGSFTTEDQDDLVQTALRAIDVARRLE
jgi:hypothetical protein